MGFFDLGPEPDELRLGFEEPVEAVTYGDLFDKSLENNNKTEIVFAKNSIRNSYIQKNNELIEQVSGQPFSDFIKQFNSKDAELYWRHMYLGVGKTKDMSRIEFETYQKLKEEDPQKWEKLRTSEEIDVQIPLDQVSARTDYVRAKRNAPEGWKSTITDLAAGVKSFGTDPVNQGATIVSFPFTAGAGGSAVMQVVKSFAIEGGVNAVIEAAVQPQIARMQKQLGFKYDVEDYISRVAGAGIIGGVAGAAITGTGIGVGKALDIRAQRRAMIPLPPDEIHLRSKSVGIDAAADFAEHNGATIHAENLRVAADDVEVQGRDLSRYSDDISFSDSKLTRESVESAIESGQGFNSVQRTISDEDVLNINAKAIDDLSMRVEFEDFQKMLRESESASTRSIDDKISAVEAIEDTPQLKTAKDVEEFNASNDAFEAEISNYNSIKEQFAKDDLIVDNLTGEPISVKDLEAPIRDLKTLSEIISHCRI